MTPNDILALPTIEGGSFHDILNQHGWPAMPDLFLVQYSADWEPPRNIEVRLHGRVIEDVRRDWIVYSVWYEGKPVAVGRAAGRERDDHYTRWIIDRDQYFAMVAAVQASLPVDDSGIDVTSPDSDIGDALHFYGETITPGETRWNRL